MYFTFKVTEQIFIILPKSQNSMWGAIDEVYPFRMIYLIINKDS